MVIFGDFFGSCICSKPRAAPFRPDVYHTLTHGVALVRIYFSH